MRRENSAANRRRGQVSPRAVLWRFKTCYSAGQGPSTSACLHSVHHTLVTMALRQATSAFLSNMGLMKPQMWAMTGAMASRGFASGTCAAANVIQAVGSWAHRLFEPVGCVPSLARSR